MRCDWPRAQTDQRPGPWLLSGQPGPLRCCPPHWHLSLAGVGHGKTGVGGDGTVIRPRPAPRQNNSVKLQPLI
jgi:hypothetical protein